MPTPFAEKCRSESGFRGPAKATSARTNDLLLGVGAFCVAFVLERLFRPFHKPMIVFFSQFPPYPHPERSETIPTPRQVA